jgi:phenylacetate-CoA ligase
VPRFPPMGAGVLSPHERHPLMPQAGHQTLTDLLESPDAPRWNHHCGDRLERSTLAQVKAFAASVLTEPPRWPPQRRPSWLSGYVERVKQVVPRYRRADTLGPTFFTSRADLERAWWDLVPDDAGLDDLIWFSTSGSGRAPVVVPTHPVTVSCYYPLLLEAARWHDVSVKFRPERADWVTVVSQRQGGFTVPSWSSVLGCATAKVNLDPSGWDHDDDRWRFLERHDPQVITGDPVSLSDLAELGADLHPKVLISTALHLSPATRERLEAHFGCPAVDVYSSTESGPVAATRSAGGMGLLQPRLFVEIIGDDGTVCAPGSPGTVTLTGGMNPYLPLLRYRTGDDARLTWAGDQPVLEGLGGRSTVRLCAADGSPVNSFDVAQLFEELPLRRWSVHQRADRSVVVSREPETGAPGDFDALDDRIREMVHLAVGPVTVTTELLTAGDKVVPFTTEVPS